MFKFLENIKLAVQSIWSKKVRSFLTMLGIIIGVFAIVMLIGIGQGLKNEVKKEIESIGSNLLFIIPGKIESGSLPTGIVGNSSLTQKDVDDISARPNIGSVTPISIVSQPVMRGQTAAAGALVFGTTSNIEDTFLKGVETDIKKGRSLSESDMINKSKVAVIFGSVKNSLFGDEDPLGQMIKIGKEEFEVIGWRAARQSGSVFSGPEYSQAVLIPLTTISNFSSSTEIHRIILNVSDAEFVESEKEGIKQLLLSNHGNVEDFSVLTQDDFLSLIDSVLSLITNMLAGIAAISLLVGGIGVMNIMLVSVTERTREIGLRKAVGASNFDVLVQFLVEAVFLAFWGGAIGIGLAFVASAILEAKIGLAPSLTSSSILMAFVFTAAVGIFFGVAPAIRAARLNPIDALKYE
jgi:putative ABC transport system permease protein